MTQISTFCNSDAHSYQIHEMSNIYQLSSDEEYKKILVANRTSLFVVNFWADWAEPCKQMNEVFTELATRQPSAVFISVSGAIEIDIHLIIRSKQKSSPAYRKHSIFLPCQRSRFSIMAEFWRPFLDPMRLNSQFKLKQPLTKFATSKRTQRQTSLFQTLMHRLSLRRLSLQRT